jgi:superfamily II DNA or RNA helicase
MSPETPQPGLLGPGAAGIDIGQGHCLDITANQKLQYPSAAPKLRPYQSAVIGRIWAMIEAAQRRILLVAPTGSGKTVIAGAIVKDAVERGLGVLILVHRRELTTQTSAKLYDVEVDHGIIQAGFPPRPGERVQIASVQTLHARAIRTSGIDLPDADLVIVDEAHHCPARTYRRLLAAYPSAIVIGLTATPCRGDGRGLGGLFDSLIECPGVAELTAAKFLVPARVFAPSQPDLSGVRVERGDYVESQLAERVDTPKLVGDIIEHWHKLAEGRRTIVYATGVAHSVHLRDEFRRAGVVAEHLDGSTPLEERDAILKGLAAGKIEVVTNCAVLIEGFDCPDIGALVLARPTKSLGLFRQMIGRALRPAPGKVDAIILDHSGAVFAHGLPDDPITWTLSDDKRAENKAHAARGTHKAPALVDCPECHAVRFEGQPCPACGWRPQPKAAPVEVIDGELAHYDRQGRRVVPGQSESEKRRFFAELRYVVASRGYKPGWAAHKFTEKFGARPPWAWNTDATAPPSLATLSWIRSRAIAWAKTQPRRVA